MLKLYGFATSNYFNMVKFTLLEKGVPFKTVPLYCCANPAVQAISARGKIPVLETEQGFISETSAILDFIENTYRTSALLPQTPYERAQVWSLAKEIELYIELPARTCYVEVYFGGRPTPPAIKEKALRDLQKGFSSLSRHASFSPYLAGNALTLADVYFLYSVEFACGVGKKLFDTDFTAIDPQIAVLLARLKAMPTARSVEADLQAELPAFLERVRPKPGGVQVSV